jgi:hypothetical protein
MKEIENYKCIANRDFCNSIVLSNIQSRIFRKYNANFSILNNFQIDNIIYDNKSRIVTIFKENLIWNEPIDLLRRLDIYF